MDLSEKNQKKKKIKIGAVIWVLLLLIIGSAALILTLRPDLFESSSGHIVTGSGGAYDRFYEPLFGTPVEEYEEYGEYLELDRYIHYKNGSVSVAITGDETDLPGEEIGFFVGYFDAVTSGDAEAYNSLFAKSYLDSHDRQAAFTPQMVYDIQVETVSIGSFSSVFDVTYKIFRNDGTFRNDIYSGASRTVRITIVDSEVGYKISELKYFAS